MRRLKTVKGRRETGLHFLEGERLVFEAASSGAVIKRAFVKEGRADTAGRLSGLGIEFDFVSEGVMRSVCDTDSPQSVCACAETPSTLPPASYPGGLIVALDGLQDPGNLGTVMRTADAFGASGILLGAGCADPFSPKALRAAMGSTYHLPVWQGDLQNELPVLKLAGASLICGHLKGEETLPPLSENRVLVIGNEGSGVSEATASLCYLYRLPMRGRAESLNAAVAASILIYKLS